MGIEYYQGELNAYCYEVSKETKPVASITAKTIYVEQMIKHIKALQLNLKVEIKEVKDYPEWSTFYIFKHEYLREVIENAPEKPNSTFDHWILGKLFGYSDAEIRKFINRP